MVSGLNGFYQGVYKWLGNMIQSGRVPHRQRSDNLLSLKGNVRPTGPPSYPPTPLFTTYLHSSCLLPLLCFHHSRISLQLSSFYQKLHIRFILSLVAERKANICYLTAQLSFCHLHVPIVKDYSQF